MPLSVQLGAASPVRDPEVDVGVVFRPHQRAALRRCVEIETGAIDADLIQHLVPHYTTRNVRARVAALCDAPGAGKSHVIIALCSGSTPVPDASLKLSHCGGMVSRDVRARGLAQVRTSVVVVPHGIALQWARYLDGVPQSMAYCRNTSRNRERLAHALQHDPPRILLCTDTSYEHVKGAFERLRLRASRLVLDEADTLRVSSNLDLIRANMYWMVTASAASLLMDTPHARDRRIRNKHVYEWWKDLCVSAPISRHLLVVKCQESFLRASMDLEEPVARSILCAAPRGTHVLAGLLDERVQRALDTDDLDTALGFVRSHGQESDIVAVLRAAWQATLDRAQVRLDDVRESQDPMDVDFRRHLTRIVESRTAWIQTLASRMADDTCAICYDACGADSAILECCSARYCLTCAAKWITCRNTCPSCRTPASFSDNAHVIHSRPVRASPPKKTAVAVLVSKLIESREDCRILFCSENRNAFSSMAGVVLKGTAACIMNTVQAFREGRFRVLCMADDCYCTGINIEFATDVILLHGMQPETERQMIGRAQRPGRTAPLRVWRTMHRGEGVPSHTLDEVLELLSASSGM